MKIKKKNQNYNSGSVDSNSLLLGESLGNIKSYCPFCNSSFSPEKTNVIGEGEGSWLLHTNCDVCHSSIIMLLVVNGIIASTFGLVTDLNSSEILKFKELEGIGIDDIIDLYSLLYLEKGDILPYLKN